MAKKRARSPAERVIEEDIPGQRDRLRRLRKAHGFKTSNAFADFLDLGHTTYNAFENGSALSRDAIFRIVQKFPGITSDWLYWGKIDSSLSIALARRLGLFDPPGKDST
jgi:hypothetical protein